MSKFSDAIKDKTEMCDRERFLKTFTEFEIQATFCGAYT